MIVATFLSDDTVRVSLEPSDLERLKDSITKEGVTREAFMVTAIQEHLNVALQAEEPPEPA